MKQKYSDLETKLKIWDNPRDAAMTQQVNPMS